VSKDQALSCLRFRNDWKQELRKLQARIKEAIIAAQRANDVRLLTFLNEIETQAATLLLRESRRRPTLRGTVGKKSVTPIADAVVKEYWRRGRTM
jgi:hypothetical protein